MRYQEDQESTTFLSKPTDLVGERLADKYELTALLGRGGMSSVYKAHHTVLNRTFAIKILHAHLLQDQNALVRFKKEAKAASSLCHPNIITIHDFEVENGRPYQVIDYLEGASLADLIAEGPLPPERAAKIFIQICSALQHAHDHGVIHRDLKPSNVMLIENDGVPDVVKIVDFGIAKVLPQEGEAIQALTQTGEIFGSPFYMSPEQCAGHPLDARSDIYSMGCLMFEALTGRPPFMGASIYETIQMHTEAMPPSVKAHFTDAAMAQRWDFILCKALAKDVSSRYQSMADLEGDLATLHSARQRPLSVITDSLNVAWLKTSQRKRFPWRLWAGLSVSILLLLTLALWSVESMVTVPIKHTPAVVPPISTESQSEFKPRTNERLRIGQNALPQMDNLINGYTDKRLQARHLRSLAAILSDNGQYEKSAVHARTLKDIFRYVEPNTIDVDGVANLGQAVAYYGSIGDACYRMGEFNMALYFYDLGIEQFGDTGKAILRRLEMKRADCYVQLALATTDTVQRTQLVQHAAASFNRVNDLPARSELPETIFKNRDDSVEPDRAVYFTRIGDLLMLQNKPSKAALAYEAAAHDWQKIEIVQPMYVDTLLKLADAQTKSQNFKGAVLTLDRALISERFIGEMQEYAYIRHHLAEVNKAQGNYAAWAANELQARLDARNLTSRR